MRLTMKKNRLLIGLASMFLLGGLLLFPSKQPVKTSLDKEDEARIAEPGMVAYAASYSTDPTSEPEYSTQNSKTFQYLNLGSTLDYYRGDSVKVGIIDSGINYDHEDFMVSGSTKVKGDSKYFEYQTSSWVFYKASQHGYSYIDDTLGHGTNVAATVAAAINSIGGTGLAPNVELYVYKVTNSNNGYEFGAIQNALMDAKELGIDIINMSFQSYEHAVSYGSSSMAASSGCSTILSYYLNQAHNAGITLVGAAGNFNTSEPSYPGSNNYVINVGSLDQNGTGKAGFSNYGSTIDLVAPGYVHVADKGTNSSYKDTSGTSFSAPLVTAAIALYKQKNPSATPAQIETALYASCDTIDDSGSAYTNWAGNGALNVSKFLDIQEEQQDGPTDIVINNSEVSNYEVELEVGDTLDLNWTVNGVGTFSDAVTFSLYENNGSISVNQSGHIEALAEGEDIVTITSDADSSVSVDLYVTVTSSSAPPTPEPASDTTQYSLINSTDDLEAGYSYIITNGTSGTVKTMANTTNANNRPTRDVTFSSGKITRGSATLSVTLEESGNYWKIKTENYTSTNNYFTQGNQTGSNYLQISSSGDNWSISFNGDAAVITSQLKTSRNIIRCNTNGTPISCYTSGQNPVYLLKQVTQSDKTLSSIAVETAPTKTTYTAGEYFNPTGLVIRRNFSDSTHDTYTYSGHTSEFTFSPTTSTALTTSNVSVTISYGGKSTTQAITVNAAAKTLSSISLSGTYTTTFNVGDTFNHNGVVVTAHYSDSTSADVTNSATFTTPDMSTSGNKTVTVSYTEGTTKTTTYSITVNSSEPTGDLTYTIGWGTASQSDGSFTNFNTTSGSVTNLLSFATQQNSAGSTPAISSSQLRLYYHSGGNGGSITITPVQGITITGFVMTVANDSGTPTVGYKIGSGSATSITATNLVYTASGFSATSTSALKIQNVNTTNKQLRIYKIKFTYEEAAPTLTGISVHTAPTKTTYTAGEYFDPTGLVITRTYSNSTSNEYSYAGHTNEFTFVPSLETALISSNTSVSITYGEKTTSQVITVNSAPVTSIYAVPNKTFYVGETISKTDITVTDNNGSTVTDFTFSNYQFTYSDAASGGSLTQKEFTNAITFGNLSCSLTAQVQRKAYSAVVPTTTWNKVSNISSLSAGDVIIIASEAQGKVLGSFSGSNKYANEGTATFSNGVATNISGALEFTLENGSSSGTWKLKNGTNYLYGTSAKTTMCLSSTAASLTISISAGNATIDFGSSCRVLHNVGSTRFSNYTSATSASMLLPQIYKKNDVSSDNPQNVANYIMYEDTTNQCTTKFNVAKGYFENLTKDGRETFMTSNDYVISNARERLLAWAAHEGKTITLSGGDYIVSNASSISLISIATASNSSIVIILVSIIGLSALGGYFFIRRRKEN